MNEIKCPNCGQMFTVDEAGFAAILSQVRTSEFDKEIEKREKEIKKNLEDKHNQDLKIELSKVEHSKIKEIDELKIQIEKLRSDKDMEISKLKQQIKSNEENQKLRINDEVAKAVKSKDEKINELSNKLSNNSLQNELAVKNAVEKIKEEYEAEIKEQQELVEYYKNFKTKLPPDVGGSLERYCEQEFRKIQGYFPKGRVSFSKDNDAKKYNDAEKGSKGDFIYRELDEYGNELLSIMFEMKNEIDTTEKKQKNKKFLEKLDKDRKNKKCEYAVLVSMLESDDDYYNQGITLPPDEQFEKMYIVRPRCFLPIITILRNAAMNVTEYKKRAADLEQRNIDITNFENKLIDFKDDFLTSYNHAKNHFDDAIKEIEETIKKLETVKEHLQIAGNKLGTANGKLEKISVKKLAKDSPSLLAITSGSDN